MRGFRTPLSVVVGLLLLGPSAARAQTFSSGSTGADGPFAPTSNVTLTLPPDGVFHFTTVTIPAGVTVRFTRNTANTPVTLLATGDVTIAGTLDVSGTAGGNQLGSSTNLASNAGIGGPGGFHGGTGANGIVSSTGGAGLGPGGGAGGVPTGHAGGGGFATAGGTTPSSTAGGVAYGTAGLRPLIGGSGGGGGGVDFGKTAGGGGGGGGAVIVASSGTITFTGTILARGGNGGTGGIAAIGVGGGGSGGAVRLVATTVTGTGGTMDVAGGIGGTGGFGSRGGDGSVGRLRIEGFTNTLVATFAGVTPSVAAPTTVGLADAPGLRITMVAGVAAPATPGASFASPDIVLPATTANPVLVALEGTNIPPGTTVSVRAQGQVGATSSATATLTGTAASTTGSASVTIPTDQPGVLTASASFTLTAAAGGPVFVQGEAVERVRVTAGWGGASQVAYITKSGREIVLGAGR